MPRQIIWESVGDDIQRSRVPGGWLVRIDASVMHLDTERHSQDGWDWRPALTFMPDPEYKWLSECKHEYFHYQADEAYCIHCKEPKPKPQLIDVCDHVWNNGEEDIHQGTLQECQRCKKQRYV